MPYPLTFVELFAGVGGLSLGLETAGWKCLGHAEWEAFPRRVLKHRWPEIPLWGDVSKLNGHEMVAQVGPFTMLTFGAPCQDFSVAGKREGLDGQRSVLVLDAIRIWEQSGAPLALYENVVGMLSSNKGEDFGAILSTFVGSRVAVPARGWRGGAGVVSGPAGVAAWRTLDAQYFGVPQRRRRVFVLCSRDPRIDPAEVLSLAEGVSGHPAPRARPRQGAPAGAGTGARGESRDGGLAINISNGEPRVSDVMGTLQARASSGGVGSGAQMNAVLAFAQNQRGELRTSGIAPQLTTGGGKPGEGYSAVLAFDAYNQQVTGEVSKTLGVGSDYSHVPIAFGLELANNGGGGNRGYTNPGEPMPTIGTGRPHGVVSASIDKQTGLVSENVSPTLKTDLAHQMGPVVATYEWHGQDSRVREIDVAASLNRNAEGREGHLVLASTFSTPAIGDIREDAVASTLTKNSGGGGETQNAAFVVEQMPVTAFKMRGGVEVDSNGRAAGKGYLGSEEMALTLGTTQDQHLFDPRIVTPALTMGAHPAAPGLNGQDAHLFAAALHAAQPGVPRRLTPVECERLMGWPDGWTDVADEKGRPAPDTARYKACGNGVASPVSAWIGFQLAAVLTKDTF